MNLSNRIYSRKILYRLIYMLNFYKYFLSKNIYIDFADKIENIINLWFDKIDAEEFEKYSFTNLSKHSYKSNMNYTLDDYISFFETQNEEFEHMLFYTMNYFVEAREWVQLERSYILENLNYLNNNYEEIIEKINWFLNSFKFVELNSVDQSILLLWCVENFATKTPKQIIIKECLMLSSAFSTTSSAKLMNAVFDKALTEF